MDGIKRIVIGMLFVLGFAALGAGIGTILKNQSETRYHLEIR